MCHCSIDHTETTHFQVLIKLQKLKNHTPEKKRTHEKLKRSHFGNSADDMSCLENQREQTLTLEKH